MEQKLRIPLIKFIYLMSRGRKKRNKVFVAYCGKMSNEDFEKYNAIANEK